MLSFFKPAQTPVRWLVVWALVAIDKALTSTETEIQKSASDVLSGLREKLAGALTHDEIAAFALLFLHFQTKGGLEWRALLDARRAVKRLE